jgi:MFS family permease
VSLGFGIVNFGFALPAVKMIDSFGRRNLLLCSLPLMALFLAFTAASFRIPAAAARKPASRPALCYLEWHTRRAPGPCRLLTRPKCIRCTCGRTG